MSKEYLEALNYVWYNYYTEELSQDEVEQIEKHLNIVQDALKRLEAIDNANPSEALEALKYFEKDSCLAMVCVANNLKERDYRLALDTIKQALLKAQEPKHYVDELKLVEKKLKALEIIKEKRVACDLLTNPDVTDYKKYNSHCDKYDFIVPLTEEEFSLLKEILGC